jgi:sulfite exporter TauE/SafE
MMPLTAAEFSVTLAFLLGLASSLHCVGMCSGIAGGLSASLPSDIRTRHRNHLRYLIAFNTGRIISYAIAGALVGALSGTLLYFFDAHQVHLFVHVSTTLILALIALYLIGLFPSFAHIQSVGRPVWRRLEPLSQKLLPVKTLPQAFLFGAVWGWIPCGLVYAMLAWALASGSAWHGATIMALYGLGTLPSMVLVGFISTWLFRLNRLSLLRQSLGVVILALAFVYLFTHDHMSMSPI